MKRKSNTRVTLVRHGSQAQQIISHLILLIILIPSLIMVKYYQNAMKIVELKCFSRKDRQKRIHKLLAVMEEKDMVTTKKKFEITYFVY